MEMQELVSAIVNSSVSVAVIAYFMYRDNKFMAQLHQTLQALVDTVNALKDSLNDKED